MEVFVLVSFLFRHKKGEKKKEKEKLHRIVNLRHGFECQTVE